MGLALTALTACSMGASADSQSQSTVRQLSPNHEPIEAPEVRVFEEPDFVTLHDGSTAMAISCNQATGFSSRTTGFLSPIPGEPTSMAQVAELVATTSDGVAYSRLLALAATDNGIEVADNTGAHMSLSIGSQSAPLHIGHFIVEAWPTKDAVTAGMYGFQVACTFESLQAS